MSNSWFKFKRFTINHGGAAMKVGTDGVLIGAWAATGHLSEGRRLSGDEQTGGVGRTTAAVHRKVLDVGAGTGLIAIMMAQRTERTADAVGSAHIGSTPRPETATMQTYIDAVEIDAESYACAAGNVAASPWNDRISLYNIPFQEFARLPGRERTYDLIVSNPPYFVDSLLPPADGRTLARHAASLSYAELAGCTSRLLAADGVFAVILPAETFGSFCAEALRCGLRLARKCTVYSLPGTPPKRVMAEFALAETVGDIPPTETELTIESGDPRDFTPEYRALTKDFYLKF